MTTIIDLLNANPKRVRGDQGEVEQRSADDLRKLYTLELAQTRSRQEILAGSVFRSQKWTKCNGVYRKD